MGGFRAVSHGHTSFIFFPFLLKMLVLCLANDAALNAHFNKRRKKMWMVLAIAADFANAFRP